MRSPAAVESCATTGERTARCGNALRHRVERVCGLTVLLRRWRMITSPCVVTSRVRHVPGGRARGAIPRFGAAEVRRRGLGEYRWTLIAPAADWDERIGQRSNRFDRLVAVHAAPITGPVTQAGASAYRGTTLPAGSSISVNMADFCQVTTHCPADLPSARVIGASRRGGPLPAEHAARNVRSGRTGSSAGDVPAPGRFRRAGTPGSRRSAGTDAPRDDRLQWHCPRDR